MSARRVLGVDARLDGVAARRDRARPEHRAGRRCGQPQHPRDQVDAVTASVTGCSTCSRVLTSRKDASLAVGVVDELDGARRAVAAPTRTAPRRTSTQLRPRTASGRSGAGASSMTFWLRRCSEQSRSPRADDPPGAVAEDLHLDVAGALDAALEEHAGGWRSCSAASRCDPVAGVAQLVRRSAQTRMPMPPPPPVALSMTG